ncbi:MAG: hypothetical protein CVU38_06975 [Chloroflexi bacterium HGW-Chloroflexi-1]|nr:MAG: hypothetical protein CVU38_06975 [Chloroflexi bacterium HGW-Chloroflexi-1]
MTALAACGSFQICGSADSSSSLAISACLPARSKTPPHRVDLFGQRCQLITNIVHDSPLMSGGILDIDDAMTAISNT